MLHILRNSWPLMLGMLLLMIGNGLQGTLIGVRGAIENMDAYLLGYVMSAYFIGFLGGSRLTPVMIRRVGHVRVFAALGSLVSAAFILYVAFVDPTAWFVLRVIVGFCFSGIYVVAESWLNDAATNETRGQSLSLYLIIQMAGIIIGQLLLNIADPADYGLFVLITVLVSVSFAPILLSTSPAPMYTTSRPMTLRELTHISPLGCFGIFVLGGIFSIQFGMASVYATNRGLSFAEISWFISMIYIGGMLFQYPIGWLSDRMDRRLLIIIVTAIGSLACVMAAMLENSVLGLMSMAMLLGGTSNPLYSLLLAYTNDFLEQDQMSAASGGLLFINGIGAMGGPILVGYIMQEWGNMAFFVVNAILMGCIAIYGIYRMTQRSVVVTGEHVPYVALMGARVSQVATEIAIDSYEEIQHSEGEHEDDTENPVQDDPDIRL